MGSYELINDLMQIRGVNSVLQPGLYESPDHGGPHINIEVDHVQISAEDLEKVYNILNSQKAVSWTLIGLVCYDRPEHSKDFEEINARLSGNF